MRTFSRTLTSRSRSWPWTLAGFGGKHRNLTPFSAYCIHHMDFLCPSVHLMTRNKYKETYARAPARTRVNPRVRSSTRPNPRLRHFCVHLCAKYIELSVRTRTRVCPRVRACTRVYARVRACTRVYARVRACTRVYARVRACTRVYARVRACTRVYARVRACTRVYARVRACFIMTGVG